MKIALVSILIAVAGFLWWSANRPESVEVMLEPEETSETWLGFIRSVTQTEDSWSLSFDDAQWLSGAEAQDAAIEAGLCTEETREDCTLNDYFIENRSTSTVMHAIDQDVLIFMQTWQHDEQGGLKESELSIEEFAGLVEGSEHWDQLPYEVTLQNGVVTQIKEVYVP